MALLKDISTARRVARNLLRARRNRRRLASEQGVRQPLAPGTIKIAVYFADTKVNLYQMRQWYAPLAELSKTWPVAIISRSPGATLQLWEEAPVPTEFLRRVDALERFVEEQDLRMVLYVNQNTKNFQMFRYSRMWHVFINHGESDKMYMTTNQFKAYDYSLVAGQAARDRLGRKLWDFDVEKKTIMIGRPQADHFAGELPYAPDERTVVLYAPTWEGDRAAAAYGSVDTHGVTLVEKLLATGRHRVIYRPHPRSGVVNRDYSRANHAIINAIAEANAADPTAQHIFDDGKQLGWQLVAADVAICDVSAMVYDRLATGKPVILTRPVSEEAEVDEGGYLGDAEWLDSAASHDIVAIVDRVQNDAAALQKLGFWVEHHFGDTAPGRATERFHEAIARLAAEWDRHAALHSERNREPDPFDEDEDDEAPPTED